jgi:hypothetical protein
MPRHALLAVAAAAVTAAVTAVGHGRTLRYFGWYDGVQSVDLPITGPSSNLVQAGSAAEAVTAKAAGQSSLLMVESLFPGLKTASPDFKTKWLPAVPGLRALLANKTIVGFGLGDELVWGGVTPAHYTQYANTVRASFPRSSGAVIWSNEACFFHGPRESWRNGKHEDVSDYVIPAALDWFSIDQCEWLCMAAPGCSCTFSAFHRPLRPFDRRGGCSQIIWMALWWGGCNCTSNHGMRPTFTPISRPTRE